MLAITFAREVQSAVHTVQEVVVGCEEVVGGLRICFGEGREDGELPNERRSLCQIEIENNGVSLTLAEMWFSIDYARIGRVL